MILANISQKDHTKIFQQQGQIAQLVEQRTENPSPYSNISDLAQKTMHTNAYEVLECIRNADKMRTLDLLPSAHPTTLTYPNKCKQL